ncbi:DUF3800 domain-containing protein [Amycolatopsis sp. NPDC059027]|uniref:DUF3800 domain-containing protein n=1 Tax=unclassified Amycolatopsis TaxID=2618356 RepID=UPI00366FD7EE
MRDSGHLVEIACDESGSEGEKLIGGETDVFAHAGVRLDVETAADCIREIRRRIRSPALEYKANHLLREKHRPVLVWLLGASSPLYGHASLYLADKAFFVVGRIVDLLVEDELSAASAGLYRGEEARGLALTLHRDGLRAFGYERWQAFLEEFNTLMRAKNRQGETSVDAFFALVDVLRLDATGPVHEILGLLAKARPRVEASRVRVLDDPKTFSALNPLIPAVVRAVTHWGAGGGPVSVVHDEQLVLTPERVARIEEILDDPALARFTSGARLAALRFVDSRSDPRVQIADFLAGVARKIASDELAGRGDAELTALLRPYTDPFSLWDDERS